MTGWTAEYLQKDIQESFTKQEQEPELFEPIIFKNTPIDCEENDVFDFKSQSIVLKNVIDDGTNIIGIIGEYGSGKSSLTEIFRKKFNSAFDKILTINLWDSCQIPNNEDVTAFPLLTKSFLYQLAFSNDNRNSHFAKYINERFNKNHGKISFSMATRKAFIPLLIAGFCFVVFFSVKNFNPQSDRILNWFEFILSKCTSFFYFFPFLGFSALLYSVFISSPIFSLWDSQGKIIPDSSDLFDIYKQITKRLLHNKKKILIFIEDLDRTAEKKLVVTFLKELYRLLSLLPQEDKQKIVFIVSLKAEEQLKYKDSNTTDIQDNPDTKDIYSKIFDYTLHIKTLHYENCIDIAKGLLASKKTILTSLFGEKEDIVISKTLKKLFWILNDENVSVREIKDRLNETFLLYQLLKNRDYENSSVELNKCAGVVFLKRKFSSEYYELLKHEKEFAELIRSNYRHTLDKDFSITVNFINDANTDKDKENLVCFLYTLTALLKDKSIDNDFLMYFYNYPKGSYIKTLDEKEVSDWIIHGTSFNLNTPLYTSPEQDMKNWNEKIERVISEKNGKVIIDALKELGDGNIPDCIFENEQIFVFLIKNEYYQETLVNQICNKIAKFDGISESDDEDINPIFDHFEKMYTSVILYDFEITIKEKIINNTLEYYRNLSKNESRIVLAFRRHFIDSLGKYLPYFKPMFTDISSCFITQKEIEKLQKNLMLLPLLEKFRDEELQKIDAMLIQSFTDKNIITFFEDKKLLCSSLLSRSTNNTLSDFDFSQDWVLPIVIENAKKLNEANPDSFIQIRKFAFFQFYENYSDFHTLFLESFPLITTDELQQLKNIEKLYFYIDHSKITLENCSLLSDYCNKKQLSNADLFSFFEALFFTDELYKISDATIIKRIILSIDFTKIEFNSMSENEISTIVKEISPAYKLGTAEGCLEFMQAINSLLPELEEIVSAKIEASNDSFEQYVSLVNKIEKPTEKTLDIIKENNFEYALSLKITDKLLEKEYYTDYIIGKTLFDKQIPINERIPTENYYQAFIYSDNCQEYFAKNESLLDSFVKNKLVYTDLPQGNRIIN